MRTWNFLPAGRLSISVSSVIPAVVRYTKGPNTSTEIVNRITNRTISLLLLYSVIRSTFKPLKTK